MRSFVAATNNIYNVKADASWTGESRIFNV